MARAAQRAGVTIIVATPHVSRRYANDGQTIRERVQTMRRALREADIELDVRSGAKIAFARLADLSDDELSALRLGDGPWLLVESPLAWVVNDFESVLDEVHRRGHWILLAHPERSPLFLRNRPRLHALVSSGMLCSVTASSLLGAFGRDVQHFALGLIRDGLVANLASNAHDSVRRPPTALGDVFATIADMPEAKAQFEWMTSDLPRAILEGDVLPKPPAGASWPATSI